MMKTPWFPGTTAPARDGVYERAHFSWGICYSLFSKGRWKSPALTPLEAARQDIDSIRQRDPWRGLTKPTH
jgi:hypothetical protein